MSDKNLFEALDLNYPGLEKAAAFYRRGDLAGAKHALAEYYRTRKKPLWNVAASEVAAPRPAHPDVKAADLVLRHQLTSIGITHQFGPVINWRFDATTVPGSPYPPNKEWTFQLNRHAAWITLADAYHDTGDEKYAHEWVAQMLQWVRDVPMPGDDGRGPHSAWRTLETGLRLSGAWPTAFYGFLHSPEFTDDALLTMVKSFSDHADHLMAYHASGNWLVTESSGLLHAGVLFPEFKDAPKWRSEAMSRLYTELDHQVYPDGVQVELSSTYHQITLRHFVSAFHIAHLNNVAVPADYLKRLQKMYEFDVYGAGPNRRLPAVQDGDASNVTSVLREASELFPNDLAYRWYATNGVEGKPPPETSHAFPYAGYYMMRSGWESDANYLMFDGGPFGYGHQHEDKLNLIVHAYGKLMLVDPGNYQYEDSKWRRYFVDSPAHNVILVDGQSQHRRGLPRSEYVVKEPLPHVWVTAPDYDYAEATFNEGFSQPVGTSVSHTRRILFVKPDYWIVCDTLAAPDSKPHRYEALFHFNSPVQADTVLGSVTTVDKEAANISVMARLDKNLQLQVIEGQEAPVQGWLPNANISSVHPAPVAIFRMTSGGAKETNLIWVLAPARAHTLNPIAAVEAVPGNLLAVRIRFRDGRIHDAVFSGGNASDLQAGIVSGHGRAVLSETLQTGAAGRSIIAAP